EEVEEDIERFGNESEIPHERIVFLRSMLKFIMHMMQSSGSPDQMRNLVETSLPNSILAIFENARLFGASILGLAITIMSTFVHNEPTSLGILQELKLPQAFLRVAKGSIPWSPEVISALPNAFGAICLNQAGLDAFNEARPIPHYLEILTSEDDVHYLQDKDLPHLVGISMDELVRHQPSLKQGVMEAIIQVLRRIIELGGTVHDDERDINALKWENPPTLDLSEPKKDRREARMSIFADVYARFLEGLFQNPTHCKEFVKLNGTDLLIQLYFLPGVPLDFVSSAASKSLSYIFRVLIEANPSAVVPVLLGGMSEAFKRAAPILEYRDYSIFAEFVDVEPHDQSKAATANQAARALATLHCFMRVFQDTLSAQNVTHSKNVTIVSNALGSDAGAEVFKNLALLFKFCAWESVLLECNTKKEWFERTVTKPPAIAAETTALPGLTTRSSSVENLAMDEVPASDQPSDPVKEDYRAANTQFFKHIFTEVVGTLRPAFQSIVRLLSMRKINDQTTRQQAFRVLDSIASVLLDCLSWTPVKNKSRAGLMYLKSALKFVAVLAVEERNQRSLLTPLVNAFCAKGGLEALLEVTNGLWDQLDATLPSDDQEKALVLIEAALSIFGVFCDSKAVHMSPYTATIQSKERDRGSPNFFDAADLVVQCRLAVLSTVEKLWNSDKLAEFRGLSSGSGVCRGILHLVSQIVKGEGEAPTRQPEPQVLQGATIANLAQALFGRAAAPSQPVVPDANMVQHIMEIGYPRHAAENALRRFHNQLQRAVDYLLSNPAALYDTGPARPSNTTPAEQNGQQDAAPAPADGPGEPAGTSGDQPATAPEEAMEGPSGSASEPQAEPMAEDVDEQAMLAQALSMSMSGPPASETAPSTSGDAEMAEADQPSETADKGKGAEQPLREELEAKRETLRASITRRCIFFVHAYESVVFDVKKLMCLVGKTDEEQVVVALQKEVSALLHGAETDGRRLGIELRLVALLLGEASLQAQVLRGMQPQIQGLFQKLCNECAAGASLDLDQAKWVTAGLLVIEAAINLGDEPVAETLKKFDENGDVVEDATTTEETAVARLPQFTDAQKEGLLACLLVLLEQCNEKDAVHAVLRLLVRLTRDQHLALVFSARGGVAKMMASKQASVFAGLCMTIIRHMCESPAVVSRVMEKEVTSWFTLSRGKTADVAFYLKSCAALACRDPDAFIRATAKVCTMPRYDADSRIQQLALKSTGDADKGAADKAAPEPLLLEESAEAAMEDHVHALIDELLKLKNDGAAPVSLTNDHSAHLHRGLILLVLVELLISFPFLRSFVALGKQGTKAASSKPHKNAFLSHLLNDILPYGLNFDPASSDVAALNKHWESSRAVLCVRALCYGEPALAESVNSAELQNVRKVVVDAIVRSFKDASASTEPINGRYSRFLALSELCMAVLPVGHNVSQPDDSFLAVSKIMIDKGLVNVLTG
ncbi:hypothetical protein HK405_006594, partial [Cladochytrium tenue]